MLELDGVSYRYRGGAAPALDAFSMVVRPGGVVAILGPNGSGKSTALGVAAGWLEPYGGSVRRTGQAAFLPQSERLAFAFTCLEYVAFGRAPHMPYLAVPRGRDEHLALDALERVGMGAAAARAVTALSGGELQLVRFARVLVQESACVLLDEPTDMLDPAHVAAVAAIVADMRKRGNAVAFSTHDLAFALAVADQVVMVKGGRVMAAGPTATVVTPAALGELYGTPFSSRSVPGPLY